MEAKGTFLTAARILLIYFSSLIPEIISAYEERNKIAGNLTVEEVVENTLISALNKVDETLPTIEQQQLINTTKAMV